jgi:hypothetical protein
MIAIRTRAPGSIDVACDRPSLTSLRLHAAAAGFYEDRVRMDEA